MLPINIYTCIYRRKRTFIPQDARFSAMCQQRLQDKPLCRNLIVTEQLNLQTFKNVVPKIYKVTHNSLYGKILVLLSSFIHSELTFYFLFLLFFPLYFYRRTASHLQNSSNFSPHRSGSRRLYHQVRWKFSNVKQAGGRGPWSLTR